jgi:hypothetical protein
MKSITRRLSILVIASLLALSIAPAQDLGAQLAEFAKLGSGVAKGYVTPLASGLGNGLNTALYHSADLHSVLGFDVQLKVGISRVPDDQKTFTFDMPPTISLPVTIGSITQTVNLSAAAGDYDAKVTAQSAAGEDKITSITTKRNIPVGGSLGTIPAGTKLFDLPGGTKLPVVGAIAPQASIGLPFGLEVMGRILPTQEFDGGKVGLTGFGVRYDVDQWIPLFPVDIAVHFATQKLTLKDKADADVLSASATAYGVEVSKSLLFLTVYGGFQLESSTIDVAAIKGANFAGTPFTIPGFSIEGSNKSRVTVGARLLLLIVNVHAEYSIADTPMLGAGVGITFR